MNVMKSLVGRFLMMMAFLIFDGAPFGYATERQGGVPLIVGVRAAAAFGAMVAFLLCDAYVETPEKRWYTGW